MENINTELSQAQDILIRKLNDKYNIKFHLLCNLFESCLKGKTKAKIKIFGSFLQKYFKDCSDLYPVFRLMFPKLDRDRATYGIQESYLARYYTQILSLPEQEKQMLKHWKNPNYQPPGAPAGDFVGLLTYVIKTRCSDISTMSLNEVNDFLDNLSKAQTSEEKTNILARLIQKASVLEQRWIVHIILKDLKIGIGHETIFKHLDPRALDVYNSTSSLIEVCNFLRDPKSSKYAHSFFQLFSPIKPMLAGRMTLEDINKTFSGCPMLIETKYDGERIQCHLHEKEVKFYTRNAVDYTYLYGPKLGSLVSSCVNAKSAILDGEIVVWDKINGKFAPFGENKQTATGSETEKQLVYMIFDIIYLVTPKGDEFSLTSVILLDRKQILKKIITEVPKKLEIVEANETQSIEEVLNIFNEAMNKGEEGIIIKKRDSIYKPDERSTDWVKVKSDYIDNLTDTLDLVIVGGYYGEGRRIQSSISTDWNDHISTFLMGVVKKVDKAHPKKSIILPMVKVGSGYTQEQLEILRQRLKLNWKRYDSRMPPSLFGNWNPAMNERPDVYIDDPTESIILEIKGAEIVPTETFPSRVTLRFPRCVNVRYDKNWEDAMKYEEVLKFYQDLQHNVFLKDKQRLYDLTPEDMEIIDKDKKRKKVDKFTKILENFRDTDTNNVFKISNLFNGYEFLILNLDDNLSANTAKKRSLESYIVEYGGTKVQNFLPSTTHVVADKLEIRAQNLLKSNDVNIYNSKWVYDCIKYNKIIPISSLYLLYINKETKIKFQSTIDKYNDNYYVDISVDNLTEIFSSVIIKNEMKDKLHMTIIRDELLSQFPESVWVKQVI